MTPLLVDEISSVRLPVRIATLAVFFVPLTCCSDEPRHSAVQCLVVANHDGGSEGMQYTRNSYFSIISSTTGILDNSPCPDCGNAVIS